MQDITKGKTQIKNTKGTLFFVELILQGPCLIINAVSIDNET